MPQPHTSQLQLCPSQSGQAQSVHPQLAADLAGATAATAGCVACALAQPHDPQSQVSHEQLVPSQSGHWQSTQAQPLAADPLEANRAVPVIKIAAQASATMANKRFMVSILEKLPAKPHEEA